MHETIVLLRASERRFDIFLSSQYGRWLRRALCVSSIGYGRAGAASGKRMRYNAKWSKRSQQGSGGGVSERGCGGTAGQGTSSGLEEVAESPPGAVLAVHAHAPALVATKKPGKT